MMKYKKIYLKKILITILCMTITCSVFTGCNNTQSVETKKTDQAGSIETDKSEADADDTKKTKVGDKEEKEMKNDEFTNEEKSMMAGKSTQSETKEVNPKADDTEKDTGNLIEINGKEIAIFSDMTLNSQKADTEYSQLNHVTFYSTTCEKEHGMNIQLPASYNTEKKYPVLYVLHGIFGDEYSMCGDGKSGVPALIDNSIASGEASEMIVVYPFMYASKDQDQCTAIDDKNVEAYDNFINELVNDIMPYMKENHSILEGKENTAVTGFSMGGREALAVGIYRPDLFGYIGAIAPAPGLVPGKDAHLNHKGQFTEEEITYKGEDPYFTMICAGDKDSVVGQFPVSYHELYTKNGIEHIWWEIPGSDHGDPAISSGIYNFIKYIFK